MVNTPPPSPVSGRAESVAILRSNGVLQSKNSRTSVSIISMNLPELVICHCKRGCTYLASVVCMDNPEWFSLSVNICAPMLDNDLKYYITSMIYRIVSLITNISTLCVIFMIKTHPKNKIDIRNGSTSN